MGDAYEDLVELGFEGVDKFATKFHDPIAGFVGHHATKWRGAKNKNNHEENLPPLPRGSHAKESAREVSPEDRGRDISPAPTPPPDFPSEQGAAHRHVHLESDRRSIYSDSDSNLDRKQYPPSTPARQRSPPSRRARFEQDDRSRYSDSESEFGKKDRENRENGNMYETYAVSGRRVGDWRDDDRNSGPEDVYEKDVEEKAYYGFTRDGRRVLVRDREVIRSHSREDDWRDRGRDDAYTKNVEQRAYYNSPTDRGALAVRRDVSRGDELVARAPDPRQYGHEERYERYEESERAVRGRPRPSRRPSSWDPPRRRSAERRWESPPRRPRSKSPNHHRAVALVIGALAGGLAGSKLKKGEAVPNTVATVAGAVVGGIGAREAEKVYDRHKERRRDEEWQERRARQWQREQGYGR
ncbi:hypothetical protein P280DRAFT_519647 [Massarina eburnea CBS 473.64]|uniref:Glycine zipper 2TM domain-containing protein n=1 Tax=Massarina eburnea CBS 473.64 TaxID=1395130 RepID=A0A6A6RT59_9PLEO|nr:hypothetical protein P280DRAFT_519647 [Massarina eburnea CBS 473.64]